MPFLVLSRSNRFYFVSPSHLIPSHRTPFHLTVPLPVYLIYVIHLILSTLSILSIFSIFKLLHPIYLIDCIDLFYVNLSELFVAYLSCPFLIHPMSLPLSLSLSLSLTVFSVLSVLSVLSICLLCVHQSVPPLDGRLAVCLSVRFFLCCTDTAYMYIYRCNT